MTTTGAHRLIGTLMVCFSEEHFDEPDCLPVFGGWRVVRRRVVALGPLKNKRSKHHAATHSFQLECGHLVVEEVE